LLPNTAPFDVTGHPAVSVPAGTSDGLPVGLMLVGEQFDDATPLAAARVAERTPDRAAAAGDGGVTVSERRLRNMFATTFIWV